MQWVMTFALYQELQAEHEIALEEVRSQNSVLKGMMEDAKMDSEVQVQLVICM